MEFNGALLPGLLICRGRQLVNGRSLDYLLALLAAYLQHGYGLLTASGLLCLMLQYVSATTRMNHGISANDRIVALFFSIYKGSWLLPMQDR